MIGSKDCIDTPEPTTFETLNLIQYRAGSQAKVPG